MVSNVAKRGQPESRTVDQRSGPSAERMRSRAVFSPRTDIHETDAHVVILTEMPGVAPDGIDITLERGVLTIRGQAAAEEHPGYRQVYAEYAGGDYERVFTLGEAVDQDNIEAAYENGLLRLTLPKAGPAKARRIDVKSS